MKEFQSLNWSMYPCILFDHPRLGCEGKIVQGGKPGDHWQVSQWHLSTTSEESSEFSTNANVFNVASC